MTEERRNFLIWGVMLLVCALGCLSLHNNPALGIHPLAIAVIEGAVYVCIMACVRLSDWRIAAVIAVVTPLYLWVMQFLDGFMIPIDIAVHLTLMGCMMLVLHTRCKAIPAVLLLALPAYAVLLLGEATALWIMKQESAGRALIVAWNTRLYSGLSILGAALLCVPYKQTNSNKQKNPAATKRD